VAASHVLSALNLPYQPEVKIGRYAVDFAMINYRIAIEIDGVYWHRDASRDARKTNFLLARGWQVIRITEDEMRQSTDLRHLFIEKLQGVPNLQLPSGSPLPISPDRMILSHRAASAIGSKDNHQLAREGTSAGGEQLSLPLWG